MTTRTYLTWRTLGHMSLDRVDRAYRDGLIRADDLDAYLYLWNTTSARFTEAYLEHGTIRQRERE